MKKDTSREYPLNPLEKSLLAWESPEIAFNSHMILDFKNPLNPDSLKNAIQILFEQIPLFRTFILETEKSSKRYFSEKLWFNPSDTLTIFNSHSAEKEEQFYHRPFRLAEEPPLRFLYTPIEDGAWRLIISVHHSACDGIGQTYLIKEFFLAYQGKPLNSWTMTKKPVNFSRHLLSWKQPWTSLGGLLAGSQSLFEKKKSSANLQAGYSSSRVVAVKYFPVRQLSFQDLSREILKVLHEMTLSQTEKPVTLVIPVNLRPLFKENKGFHNFAGLCRIEFDRSEAARGHIDDKLKALQDKKRITQVFYSAFIANHLLSRKNLKAQFQKLDQNPTALFSTALLSVGRFPSSLQIPKELELVRSFGRGALFHSPGLGFTMTGPKDNPVLVVQYLKESIPDSVILELLEKLKICLAI